MALASMVWKEVSIHKVILEFLRGEYAKSGFHPRWSPIITNPNLNDPVENHQRLRLLYIPRTIFMIEIPPDTKWYEVDHLTENELGELYVSAKHNPEWDQAGNKLDQVAQAVREPLKAPPNQWAQIILWGHSEMGPFSILEGCHRMLGYAAATSRPPLRISPLIGLSSSLCFWHHADPWFQVGQGLFGPRYPSIEGEGWIYQRAAN
jgi:hypothetical protein